MNKFSLLITALAAAVSLSACDRPSVVNNPPPSPTAVPVPVPVPTPSTVPGPPGPQGEQGKTGAPGAPGTSGDTTVIVTPPSGSASATK